MKTRIIKGVYLAGNFLSQSTGVTSPCEELAKQFQNREYFVVNASHHRNRFSRMADLLCTALNHRDRYQAALVDVYSFMAFYWAELLCFLLSKLDKPYILNLHGGKLPEFAEKQPKRFQRLLNSAVAVTTPSILFCQQFAPIRTDIHYIPNGINLANYPYKLRVNPKPNILWMHSFHQVYNPLQAAHVLKLVSEHYPLATLSMIGPDQKDGSLISFKSLVENLNLSNKVNNIGAILKSDVGHYLSQGDIYINTTNYESFGVSTMESAACGLCIITTDAGELPYLWENGVDALIVPKNDSAAMADALLLILNDPALAQKLSSNARKKAENYDWSNITSQWEALISEVIIN